MRTAIRFPTAAPACLNTTATASVKKEANKPAALPRWYAHFDGTNAKASSASVRTAPEISTDRATPDRRKPQASAPAAGSIAADSSTGNRLGALPC